MTSFNDLVRILTVLPGIGKKSAARIAFFLLKNKDRAIEISESLKKIISNILSCSICGDFTTSDPCSLCMNPSRDKSILCIVENPLDLHAIEETGFFKGLYHILMGVINPLEGITPDKLRINELIARIEQKEFKEILIATNPTTEGEATFLFISNILSKYNLRISRLATGLPMGGSLEYADKLTLTKALQSKNYI